MNKVSKFLKNTKYISDIHLEKNHIRNIKADKPNIILAGDIGYPFESSYQTFIHEMAYKFEKVFVISGNHEYDGFKNISIVENKIKNICNMRRNVHYLQKDTYMLCSEDNLYLADLLRIRDGSVVIFLLRLICLSKFEFCKEQI